MGTIRWHVWVLVLGSLSALSLVACEGEPTRFTADQSENTAIRTQTPSFTPTPTPAMFSSPLPTPVVTPSPLPTPVVTPSPLPTPVVTPSPLPTPVVTPSPLPTPVITPSPSPTPTPLVKSNDVDRSVLVAFYNATNGTNWSINTGWLSDEPIGEWRGVVTDNSGRVIELNIINNGLRGELPLIWGVSLISKGWTSAETS